MVPTRVLLQRKGTIGFVGLGAMGRGMSANLLSKTFANREGVYEPNKDKPVFAIYDAYQPAVDSFLNEHVRSYAGRDILPSSSPAGLVKHASTIFTMLPSSPQVEEVYLGENGLLEGLKELSEQDRQDTLFVDCTTLDPGVAKEVSKLMQQAGAGMIDAPVSGGQSTPHSTVNRLVLTLTSAGVVGAEAGTLSFMCGGPEESSVLPLISTRPNF